MGQPLLTVIIPTLNEEDTIAGTLYSVLTEEVEVLVVDGGSIDQTCIIAKQLGATVITSDSGRGVQMNRGVAAARGDIILFLHADTELPTQYLHHALEGLNSSNVAVGAFRLHLRGNRRGLAVISHWANIRSKWLGLVYGDQALFMTKALFEAVGGYPETAIMEDFILVQKLRKKGRIKLIDAMVKSSGRRWDKYGLWVPTLVNQMIIVGFFFGISPDFLAKIYGIRK